MITMKKNEYSHIAGLMRAQNNAWLAKLLEHNIESGFCPSSAMAAICKGHQSEEDCFDCWVRTMEERRL